MWRNQRAPNSSLEARISTLSRLIRKREPGPAVLSMKYQRSRCIALPINEQDDHLAIAILSSVMRAGTAGVS